MTLEERLGGIARKYGISNAVYLPRTTSTNEVARDPSYGHGDVIIAGSQTAGRGQRGNTWSSEEGKNLMLSLVVEPGFLPAASQFLLSEVAALSIADTLQSCGIVPSIKWTNDVYVGDRKIAGILIENDIKGSHLSRSVIGIGLNVNQTKFDPSLPNPTSMALATGQGEPGCFDVMEVFGLLYGNFVSRYHQLEDEDCDGIAADYDRMIYGKNTHRLFRHPDGEIFRGIIRGVRHTGELLVEHEGGRIREYLFREIEFIIEPVK